MSDGIPRNRVILDEFVSLAMLTPEEEKVIRTRFAGWSRTKQAMEFNISLSSIDRLMLKITRRYDEVQPYSQKLPPRHRRTK